MIPVDSSIKRILAVNFGGIGDEILFFPVIQTLREGYPEAKITVLLEPRCKGIMAFNPAIDEVLTFDVKSKPTIGDFLKTAMMLRKHKFDLAIASGSHLAMPVLLFLSGARHRVCFGTTKLSHLLCNTVPLNKKRYAARMYYELVNFIPIEFRLPQAVVPVADSQWAKEFLENVNAPKVVFHPGVSKLGVQKGFHKSWTPERWAELAQRLMDRGISVILAGGPEDDEAIEGIKKHLTREPIMAYGQTKSIGQLAALMEQSDAVVAVDSAPMHVGVAVGTPVVAIFGPTDPEKLLPKETQHQAIYVEELECRPCLWDRRKQSCEARTCLNVSVEQVEAAVLRVIPEVQ